MSRGVARKARSPCKLSNFAIISFLLVTILLSALLLFLLPSAFMSNTNNGEVNFHDSNVKDLTPEEMNSLIGLKFSTEPHSSTAQVITREKLPKNSRVIPPGSFVTMDFQEDRLNVHIDSEGTITKVKKG